MTNEIAINVAGNAVSDPQRRITASGLSVTSFRFACHSRRWDPAIGRTVDSPSSYYTVSCWHQLADNVADSVVKGQPVLVQGFLKRRVYVRDDGQKVTYDDIEARSVGHDLSRGVARFAKTPRPRTGPDVPAEQVPDAAGGPSSPAAA